jgi:ribosomal protein S15P/S13E
MKLTKSKLKQIIREELGRTEDKETHIGDIVKKLIRLKHAVRNAEKGMQNMEQEAVDDMDLQDIMTHPSYWAKQEEVMNLNNKIELLTKQLQQLKQDEPGQLERGG